LVEGEESMTKNKVGEGGGNINMYWYKKRRGEERRNQNRAQIKDSEKLGRGPKCEQSEIGRK